MEEEAGWMAKVVAGDAEGLGGLYDRHHGPLYGFFLRLTGCGATAEDLVHDVFVRVLRYAASFRPDAPFRPWLYRIARNVHADVCGAMTWDALEDTLPCPEASPHSHAVAMQDRTRLESALQSLRPEQREILLLSRDPDWTYAQIAELLGCSESAVKVRVHRALAALRQIYFEGGRP